MAEELGLFGEEPEFNEPAPAPAVAPAPAPAVEAAPEPVKAEEPKGETVDASPASERPRDDSGRFVKKDDDHMVPLSAMLSERERRQAAEKELQEARAQTAVKPDVWTDPEAFVKSQLEAREPEILAKAEVKAREQFFRYTENAAIDRHSKDAVPYEKAREAFIQEAQRNPLLASQLRESADPGEFIYRQGKTALELQEVGGDLSAYRTKIETEIRQKLEKEAAERKARNDAIPQSLNSEPSKGAGVKGQTWAGPTQDETLFPER